MEQIKKNCVKQKNCIRFSPNSLSSQIQLSLLVLNIYPANLKHITAKHEQKAFSEEIYDSFVGYNKEFSFLLRQNGVR